MSAEDDLRRRVDAFAGDLHALIRREALHAYLAGHAGQRAEQIARALAIPSKELALLLRKLLAARRITSRGQKRATRYFAR